MTDHSYPSNPGSEEADSMPLDVLFALLGDRHRRRVVTALVDEDSRTVEELVGAAPRGEPRTHELPLVHVHLPKLQEAGVIEWESDAGVVRRGPRFDAVEAVVALLRSNEDVLPADWP